MPQTVLVSGTFDLLHSGHVRFFQTAAEYGQLHVGVGSDRTVARLKGRAPITSEEERLFMVRALSGVSHAFVSSGSGYLDFEPEMRALKPGVFVVNHDGHHPDKAALCDELGTRYVVLDRVPEEGLPERSTTALRTESRMPFRIDLCGGWLDQPFVSREYPGCVVTLSLEPTEAFNSRSGMASSTRRTAVNLWGEHLPAGDPAKWAQVLFACDNPPGTTEISGSQDAIGIVYPGLARAHYAGEYWPAQVEQLLDDDALRFVEDALYLVPLDPRSEGYDVLGDTHIDRHGAKALAVAADACWTAIQNRDLRAFGESLLGGLDAQIAMFPAMMTPQIQEMIEAHRDHALGWKISGAGGGGYLILVSEDPVDGAIQIKARREGI